MLSEQLETCVIAWGAVGEVASAFVFDDCLGGRTRLYVVASAQA